MKKTFVFLIAFLILGCLFAQKQKKNNSGLLVKVHTNINYSIKNGQRSTQLYGSPVLIYQGTGRMYHEFELTRLSIKHDNNSALQQIYNRSELGLSYQLTYPLVLEKKLMPYIGGGIGVFFTNLSSAIENIQERSQSMYAGLQVVPGIRWGFLPHLFLDISLVQTLVKAQSNQYRTTDPSLPIKDQKKSDADILGLPLDRLHIRLGVGIRL